jgi:hypothetical protein
MSAAKLAERLPSGPRLRELSKTLAVLDAVMSPSWEGRYYSFDSTWGAQEELASMRNGQGDEYSIVFCPQGVYIRGFDHESPLSPYRNDGRTWPGLVDSVPEAFEEYVNEPSFGSGNFPLITVCLWQMSGETEGWHHGDARFPDQSDVVPDGADWLFTPLTTGTPEFYGEFAHWYYERELDPAAIDPIYRGTPLTQQMINQLNPDVSLTDIADDLTEIGYPFSR